jgi:inner membrane protein
MDTVTQLTLGAAVGEAVLGKKIGNKAPLWGAFFGVVPDLDVLVSPFVTEVQSLAIHRGITHSLFFCFVAAPLFGWILSRYWSKPETSWKDWSLLVFLVLATHILIDVCTSYGTQVLQPFSNYSLSLNSIFIIDPFYTLFLMTGIVTALFLRRTSRTRRWTNVIGLALSSLYLLAGLGVKNYVNAVFEENFEHQQIRPEKYMTTPAPFTIFLWTGYAEEGDSLYAGLYSIFDEDRQIKFHTIPQNESLLDPYRGQLPVERLIWFSQGYYAVEKKSSGVLFHDLRFGRSDLWLTNEAAAPFVWNYEFQFNKDSSEVIGFNQYEPSFDTRSGIIGKLIQRTFGKDNENL